MWDKNVGKETHIRHRNMEQKLSLKWGTNISHRNMGEKQLFKWGTQKHG